MNEENKSRGSDLDLSRILEEYSAINREKSLNTPQNSNYRKQTEFSNSSFNMQSSSDNRNVSSVYSGKQTVDNNKPAQKKFVLHIDESIIDSPGGEQSSKPQTNNSGIYFSNYQKNNEKRTSVEEKKSKTNKSVSQQKSDVNKTKKKAVGGKQALIFLAVIILTTALLSYIGITCVCDMLAINRSEESVEITIPENSEYSDVIDILHENDLIKNKLFCKVFTKYRKFDEEKFLSGKYYLSSSMGLEGMLRDMIVAQVSADTIKLSFPEGWTVQQIFEKLEKNDVCESSKLYSTIKLNYSYDFFEEIADNEKRYLKLEGYLFPDTYDFFVGADTNYVIKKFLDNFESKWTGEYQARADKLGYTCDEIITIASIIQKEADNVEQMKTISSVIHNRLNNSSRYPTLGCDATGVYISNYVTPVVGDALGLTYYNYYETRSNKGLPPGPICNPGMDAIKAALYPDNTNYYFFAHDNKGKIYLAETLDGHNTNLVKIIKANNED